MRSTPVAPRGRAALSRRVRVAQDPGLRVLLRQAGLRATPQRLAVLDVLHNAGGHHFSAEDVWQALGRVSAPMDRSTAYRVLSDLAEAGLLKLVRLQDGVARFEVQAEAHHHAVCITCGATADVEFAVVKALSQRLQRSTGFVLGDQPLLLSGVCEACAAG